MTYRWMREDESKMTLQFLAWMMGGWLCHYQEKEHKQRDSQLGEEENGFSLGHNDLFGEC